MISALRNCRLLHRHHRWGKRAGVIAVVTVSTLALAGLDSLAAAAAPAATIGGSTAPPVDLSVSVHFPATALAGGRWQMNVIVTNLTDESVSRAMEPVVVMSGLQPTGLSDVTYGYNGAFDPATGRWIADLDPGRSAGISVFGTVRAGAGAHLSGTVGVISGDGRPELEPPNNMARYDTVVLAVDGYRVGEAGGGGVAEGSPGFFGSMVGKPLAGPIVGLAGTPSEFGYWLVGADGGVFAFGDAHFFGSMARRPLAAPIVSITPTPSGQGYWLVGADGGVFAFGDAHFYGSADSRIEAPVVGMATDGTGRGYWLVERSGLVIAYGDAADLGGGGLGSIVLAAPIVGITADRTGRGYWLAGADGGVFAFGDAGFSGSMVGRSLAARIVAIAAGGHGGYRLLGADGGVFCFGGAAFYGRANAVRPVAITQ